MKRTLLKHIASAVVFVAAAFGAAALVQAPTPVPLADDSGKIFDVTISINAGDAAKQTDLIATVSGENNGSAKIAFGSSDVFTWKGNESYSAAESIKYTRFNLVNPQASVTTGQYVEYTYTPTGEFTPKSAEIGVINCGWGDGRYRVTVIRDGKETELKKDVTPKRNNDTSLTTAACSTSYEISDLSASTSPVTLRLYLYSRNNQTSTRGIGVTALNLKGTNDMTNVSDLPYANITWSSDNKITYRVDDEIPAMPTFVNTENCENVVFESSNEEIATVDQNGVVTAKNTTAGTAIITATANEDEKGTYQTTSVSFEIEVKPCLITTTFELGDDAIGTAPAAVTVEKGKTVKIPANCTVYSEGKTLVGWSDGENTLKTGSTYTPTASVSLTPVFKENTVSLYGNDEAITIKWDFQQNNGAPSIQWQGVDNLFWVGQAKVNGQLIDVVLPFTTVDGKFNTSGWNDWAQINGGTTFKVPSAQGAIISMECYNNTVQTTINGNSVNATQKVFSYAIEDEGEFATLVVGDDVSYARYITVTLPSKFSEVYEYYFNGANETYSPAENNVITANTEDSRKHNTNDTSKGKYQTTLTTPSTPSHLVNATKGLKLEGSTRMEINTTAYSNVIIVQSQLLNPGTGVSYDGSEMNMEEGVETILDQENNTVLTMIADNANTVNIYTIKNVAPGAHWVSIGSTKPNGGSNQSGIIYIGVGYLIEQPIPELPTHAIAKQDNCTVEFENVLDDDVLHFTVEGVEENGELKKHEFEGTSFDINHADFALAPATLHTITPYVNGVAGKPVKVVTKPVTTQISYFDNFRALGYGTLDDYSNEELYQMIVSMNEADGEETRSFEELSNTFCHVVETIGEGVTVYYRVADSKLPAPSKVVAAPAAGYEEYTGSIETTAGSKVNLIAAAELEDGTTLYSAESDVTTFVAEVFGEGAGISKVYDLNGREVKGDLQPGVYVVVSGKKAVKVVIR